MSNEKWSGWFSWPGSNVPPVNEGTIVDIEYRCGKVAKEVRAGSYRWTNKGCDVDIIAYRYKIKEPESDMVWTGPTKAAEGMNINLAWLAKFGGPIPEGATYAQYNAGDGAASFEWFTAPMSAFEGLGDIVFSVNEIIQARQQLGLDQPEVTPEEDEAWQDKERELIGGPRKAESFLMQAAELMAERGKQYDQPGGERSMGKAVNALNAITGRDLTEAEGWLLMSLVKRVRQHSGAGYHQDSAEDAVAYAALEAEALEGNSHGV